MKFNTWEETFAAVKDIISKEASRYRELQTSPQCDNYDKKISEQLLSGQADFAGKRRVFPYLYRHWCDLPADQEQPLYYLQLFTGGGLSENDENFAVLQWRFHMRGGAAQ